MVLFAGFMLLAFYGLAICTIGGMLANGINAGLAMLTAILEVIIGMVIVREIYQVKR